MFYFYNREPLSFNTQFDHPISNPEKDDTIEFHGMGHLNWIIYNICIPLSLYYLAFFSDFTFILRRNKYRKSVKGGPQVV